MTQRDSERQREREGREATLPDTGNRAPGKSTWVYTSGAGDVIGEVSDIGEMSDVRGEMSDVRGVMSDVRGVMSDVKGMMSDVRGEQRDTKEERVAAQKGIMAGCKKRCHKKGVQQNEVQQRRQHV